MRRLFSFFNSGGCHLAFLLRRTEIEFEGLSDFRLDLEKAQCLFHAESIMRIDGEYQSGRKWSGNVESFRFIAMNSLHYQVHMAYALERYTRSSLWIVFVSHLWCIGLNAEDAIQRCMDDGVRRYYLKG